MRSDMAKVIVERPRSGHYKSNWTVRVDRGRARDGDPEALPKRRGMRPRHADRKWLNENLRPLVRFLRSRLNRPWDKIYSELRAQMDVRSATQKHIFEHLEDFVALHVRWQDGVLIDTSQYAGWRPLVRNRFRTQFYVDPRSGLLREAPSRPKPVEQPATHRQVIKGQTYVKYHGIWFAVRFESLTRRYGRYGAVDYDHTQRFDVLLKAPARTDNEAERGRLYGESWRCATWKKPLNRKELKQLGLWRR